MGPYGMTCVFGYSIIGRLVISRAGGHEKCTHARFQPFLFFSFRVLSPLSLSLHKSNSEIQGNRKLRSCFGTIQLILSAVLNRGYLQTNSQNESHDGRCIYFVQAICALNFSIAMQHFKQDAKLGFLVYRRGCRFDDPFDAHADTFADFKHPLDLFSHFQFLLLPVLSSIDSATDLYRRTPIININAFNRTIETYVEGYSGWFPAKGWIGEVDVEVWGRRCGECDADCSDWISWGS